MNMYEIVVGGRVRTIPLPRDQALRIADSWLSDHDKVTVRRVKHKE